MTCSPSVGRNYCVTATGFPAKADGLATSGGGQSAVLSALATPPLPPATCPATCPALGPVRGPSTQRRWELVFLGSGRAEGLVEIGVKVFDVLDPGGQAQQV